MKATTENWLPIDFIEGIPLGCYEVSDLGRVRSLARVVSRDDGSKRLRSARLRKLKAGSDGYVSIRLNYASRGRFYMVHRLVAAAFIPNPEGKPEVNHIDGDKANNRVGNLEWVTSSENVRHAVATGLHHPTRGSKHGMSKLTEQDVIAIRIRLANGESQRSVARSFGVHFGTIWQIRHSVKWRHLPPCPSLAGA